MGLDFLYTLVNTDELALDDVNDHVGWAAVAAARGQDIVDLTIFESEDAIVPAEKIQSRCA